MATNLLDACRGLITPELVGAAASRVGESEGSTSKALTTACPLILSGLVQKTTDPGAMGQIMSLLTNPSNDSAVLTNPRTVLSSDPSGARMNELGDSLLSMLFGGDLGAITTALSDYAGVNRASASSLLTTAAPLVLALLGNRVRREGLSTAGLISLLAGQRDSIQSAVPGVLASILGFGRPRVSTSTAPMRHEESTASRWLWPVAALVLLGLVGLWAFTRGRVPEQVAKAPQAASDAAKRAAVAAADAPRAAVDAAAGLGAFMTRRLPSNLDLNIPERGVEMQVITFLGDPTRPIDPNLWFNFDRITFETDSAHLKPESREQLKNVAEILKAYPTMTLKIGGYTDNTGSPDANLQLSQARAASVVNELVALGIPADRLSAEGYGEQFPVADNSTEAGRAQNRRIAMRVTQR